jgi:hypothetical protein
MYGVWTLPIRRTNIQYNSFPLGTDAGGQMSALLSYPLINPSTSMLYQALLYWDGIATIAPHDHRGHLSPDMRRVDDEGLYRSISAERILRDPATADAALNQLLKLQARAELDGEANQAVPWVRIVNGKLPHQLFEDIAELGLGQYDSRSQSMLMEGTAASALLSIVAREAADRRASASGHLTSNGLMPHTDQAWAFRVANLSDAPAPERRPVTCLQLEIGNLLPVPAEETSIASILEFRQRYDDERRRMMLEFDNFVHDLSSSYNHPDDIRHVVAHELELARADFFRAAGGKGIRFLSRSLWLLIAAAASYGSTGIPHWQWLGNTTAGVAINVATSSARPGANGRFDRTYLQRIYSEPVVASHRLRVRR